MTAHATSAPAADADPELAGRDAVLAELSVARARLRGADDAELADAELALGAATARLAGPSTLDEVAIGFGLSAFERAVLLLACGPELVAAAGDDLVTATGARRLTFGAALALLPDAHWSAITPRAPLRHFDLLRLLDPHSPTGSALVADERILHHIAGVRQPDPALAVLASHEPPARLAVPVTLARAARRVATAWRRGHVPVVHGSQRANLRAVLAAATAAIGRTLQVIAVEDWPSDVTERARLLRRMERESVLQRTAWAFDLTTSGSAASAPTIPMATVADFRGPLAVLAPTADFGSAASGAALEAVAVERLDVGERRAALTAALAGVGGGASDAEIDAAAAVFDLPLENLAAAAADVRRGVPLWSACRTQTRSAVRDLARVVRPRATWDDLVLPAAQTDQLHALVASVGHRARVLDGWGFGARTTRDSARPRCSPARAAPVRRSRLRSSPVPWTSTSSRST